MQQTMPRYLEVAVDLASRVLEGNYREGDRVFARSALASQYGVSAETARRAVCVLSDLGVLEAVQGSGVIIRSAEKAGDFLRHYRQASSLSGLKGELLESLGRQRQALDEFEQKVTALAEQAERYRMGDPFVPYHFTVDERCTQLGKNLAELNFWHHTGATVIAIRQGDRLLLSPGPYAVLSQGSELYYFGDEKCVERVHSYLTK